MAYHDDGAGDARSRVGNAVVVSGVIVGILLCTVMVLSVSRAVFAAETSNSQNFVSIGDVTLTDNDGESALVEMGNVGPGDSETTCIEVEYAGSIADPSAVVVYSGGYDDPESIASEINLVVEEGTGAETFDDCAGFILDSEIFSGTLDTFNSTYTDYATGAGAWEPSTGDTRAYRITVELDSDADSAIQGQSLTDLVFTWEVQS